MDYDPRPERKKKQGEEAQREEKDSSGRVATKGRSKKQEGESKSREAEGRGWELYSKVWSVM
jgi:hypothetical protein